MTVSVFTWENEDCRKCATSGSMAQSGPGISALAPLLRYALFMLGASFLLGGLRHHVQAPEGLAPKYDEPVEALRPSPCDPCVPQ